jgi:hypothetical protein
LAGDLREIYTFFGVLSTAAGACRIAPLRISPGGGPFPSATLMDSKFIGINAFFVLN